MKITQSLKNALFFLVAGTGLMLSSCSGDPDLPSTKGDSDLNVTPSEISFKEAGGEESITVKATQGWKMILPENAEWISATPETGKEGSTKVTVKVSENTAEERAANILFKSGEKEVSLAVKQDGKAIALTSLQDVIAAGLDVNKDGRTITEDWTIRGTITNDPQGANTPFGTHGYYYIQDGDHALVLTLPKGSKLNLNKADQLTIKLKEGKLSNFYGMVQVQPASDEMVTAVASKPIEPKEISAKELADKLSNNELNGVLVKLSEVQFKASELDAKLGKSGATNRPALEAKDGSQYTVTVFKKAVFGDQAIPKGSGTIVGNASKFKKGPHTIIPSVLEDIKLTADRFKTGGDEPENPDQPATDAKVFISEYYTGSGYNKFLELYNPEDKAVTLTSYKLILDVFSGKNFSSKGEQVYALDKIEIPAKSVIVFKNSKADIADIPNLYINAVEQPNIDVILNFNGDDNIILTKDDKIVDIIGQRGKALLNDEGNGRRFQYSKLVRKAAVKKGNPSFDENGEWEVVRIKKGETLHETLGKR